LNILSFNDAETPSIDDSWKKMSDLERMNLVENVIRINNLGQVFSISRITEKGEVYINLLENLSAGQRGSKLLDFEMLLKDNLDNGIVLWCEPLGDKNSLRKLRGIQIKKGGEL
jgi:hypothetical protein